jgi:hypothetical protein
VKALTKNAKMEPRYIPSESILEKFNLKFFKTGKGYDRKHYRGKTNKIGLQIRCLIDTYENGNKSYLIQVKALSVMHPVKQYWSNGFDGRYMDSEENLTKLIKSLSEEFNIPI